MGDHYIPRFYLKGFTQSPESDRIWVYERGKESGFISSVKSIANEKHLYTREVEAYLANQVEGRANPIIRKIREHIPISSEEKKALAKYILVLWKRVPNHKILLQDKYPKVLNKVITKIDDQFLALLKERPDQMEIIEKRREELKNIRTDEEKKKGFLDEFWITNIRSDNTTRAMNALCMMNWCYWITKDEYFVTSDNPLFFFNSIGLANVKSEVSIPISKTIALWATWRTDIKEGSFLKARRQIVREINRRTIKNATRFIFCSDPFDWVIKILSKSKIYLSWIE